MEVITIETASLGDRSYVVHDGAAALVIDPQRDIDRVLSAVEAADVRITHVAETHVHNDYVSGGLALARTLGATYLNAADDPVCYDHGAVSDGDRFSVGDLSVEVLHTPGHTPHHLSYVVRSEGRPPALFTGGSLLHGTVGRTDLITEDMVDELTRAQLHSARRLADAFPDEASVYPTHGFGSFCASAQSEGESDGTLGTERRINVALTAEDEDAFVSQLVAGLTPHPRYYAQMGPLNRAGAVPVDLSVPALVDPVELARRIHRGEWVVDLRHRRVFAAEHLTGTIGVELADPFATYLGWLMPWGTPVTLLGDTAEQVAEAQRQLARIGIDRPHGAATGGPAGWAPDHDRRSYRVVDFIDVAAEGSEARLLDVRRDDERAASHIEGSRHIPIHELPDRVDELPDTALWVHCASGFRASIGASILDRAGCEVVLVDDSYEHAEGAGLPVRLGHG